LILLDSHRSDAFADMLGDTPFTVTPYFFLRRREGDVYADDAVHPRCAVVVPHVRFADVYVFVFSALTEQEVARLADFVGRLELSGGLFVPAGLVRPIRARRRVSLEVEGLCFTYRQIPRDGLGNRGFCCIPYSIVNHPGRLPRHEPCSFYSDQHICKHEIYRLVHRNRSSKLHSLLRVF